MRARARVCVCVSVCVCLSLDVDAVSISIAKSVSDFATVLKGPPQEKNMNSSIIIHYASISFYFEGFYVLSAGAGFCFTSHLIPRSVENIVNIHAFSFSTGGRYRRICH